MTVAIPTGSAVEAPPHHSRMGWAVLDSVAVAKRNLIAMTRIPQVLVFSTVQPVIFVLMFRYVFGGAIHVPGVRYVDFLMAGIFVQTVSFGSTNTGVGLAEDLQKGLIERFRSLAMARSAVLAGRTLADAVRNLFVIVLMVVVGFIVGLSRAYQRPRPAGGDRLSDVVWVRHVVGDGHHRALHQERRGRPGRRLPGPGRAGVRVERIRAYGQHAGPAAGLRQPPTGVRQRQRRTVAGAGRSHPLQGAGGRRPGASASSPCSPRWRWPATGGRPRGSAEGSTAGRTGRRRRRLAVALALALTWVPGWAPGLDPATMGHVAPRLR